MKAVSERSANILIQLVAWEMLHEDSSVDPQALLRSLPLEDLHTVHANVFSDTRCLEFTTVQMVDLELKFRLGLLHGDWSYERDNTCVKLKFAPVTTQPTLTPLRA
jgi:hypothetical protein